MDTQSYNLEDFSHWKIEALRSFLNNRGLPTTGNKQELIALAFSASKLQMPVLPTAAEVEKSKEESYCALLKVGDVVLPDPLLLYVKWEDKNRF